MSAFKSCQIILLFEQYTHSQEDDLWFSYFEVAPLRCEVFREVTFHEWAALCSLLCYICWCYTLLYSALCSLLCYRNLLLYSAFTATELFTLCCCACFTLQPATYHRNFLLGSHTLLYYAKVLRPIMDQAFENSDSPSGLFIITDFFYLVFIASSKYVVRLKDLEFHSVISNSRKVPPGLC